MLTVKVLMLIHSQQAKMSHNSQLSHSMVADTLKHFRQQTLPMVFLRNLLQTPQKHKYVNQIMNKGARVGSMKAKTSTFDCDWSLVYALSIRTLFRGEGK
jgi:hypothetical protein